MKIPLTLKDILAWLREDNSERLKTLWGWADETRRLNVGDTIHLRGLVEISSRCNRQFSECLRKESAPSRMKRSICSCERYPARSTSRRIGSSCTGLISMLPWRNLMR